MDYTIEKLNSKDYGVFAKMFIDYFINDIGVKYDKNKLEENLVKNTIINQLEKDIVFVDVIRQKEIIGFIIYQIDNEKSDWQERVGWGFIREFYIKKEYRNKGYGSILLLNTENQLKKLGVKNIYLTSNENAKEFYLKNNYSTNNVINEMNNNEVYEKDLTKHQTE